MNIDYSKITDNPKVIELLKQRIELENKIKAIDEMALINHEIELLNLFSVNYYGETLYNTNGVIPSKFEDEKQRIVTIKDDCS